MKVLLVFANPSLHHARIEIEDEEDLLKVKPTISPTDYYEPPGPGEMFGRYWKSVEEKYESLQRRQKDEDVQERARRWTSV